MALTRLRTKTAAVPKPMLSGFLKRHKEYRFEKGMIIQGNGNGWMGSESIKEYQGNSWSPTLVHFPAVLQKQLWKNPTMFRNLKFLGLKDPSSKYPVKMWEVTDVNPKELIAPPKRVLDENGEFKQLFSISVAVDRIKIASTNVLRETEKQYVLETELQYRAKWNKAETGRIISNSNFRSSHISYFAICEIDRLDELRDSCIETVQKRLTSQIENIQTDLKSFNKLKEENGY
jgi:hypothetical protein